MFQSLLCVLYFLNLLRFCLFRPAHVLNSHPAFLSYLLYQPVPQCLPWCPSAPLHLLLHVWNCVSASDHQLHQTQRFSCLCLQQLSPRLHLDSLTHWPPPWLLAPLSPTWAIIQLCFDQSLTCPLLWLCLVPPFLHLSGSSFSLPPLLFSVTLVLPQSFG